MTADLGNGLFEGGGAIMLLLNLRQLVRDKKVAGVHWGPIVFWTLWGFWNLYYYPSLHQWASFAGGVGVVACNTAWLGLAFYYRRNDIRLGCRFSGCCLDEHVLACYRCGAALYEHEFLQAGWATPLTSLWARTVPRLRFYLRHRCSECRNVMYLSGEYCCSKKCWDTWAPF